MDNYKTQQKKNSPQRMAKMLIVLVLITTCLLSMTLAKYVVGVSGTDSARVAQLKFEGILTGEDEAGTAIGSTSTSDFALFKTAYKNTEGATTIAENSGITADALNTSELSELIAPGILGSVIFDISGVTEVTINLGLTITETQKNNGSYTIPIFYEYDGKYYTKDSTYTAMITAGKTLLLDLSNSSAPNDGLVSVSTADANFGGDLDALAVALVADVTGVTSSSSIVSANTTFATPAGGLEVTWYWPFEVYDDADTSGTINTGDVLLSDVRDTALGTAMTQDPTLNIDSIKLDIAATATQVD